MLESTPGHLACAATVLPLSYENQTTNYQRSQLFSIHVFTRSEHWQFKPGSLGLIPVTPKSQLFTVFYCTSHHWMTCLAHVNVQPRTKYDLQEAGRIHTQACACTECSINMITDDVNCVSVSMVTVHVVWGLFPLMRFALETNVSPPLSTGLSWLWGCREKRGTSLSWKILQ